MDLGTYQVVSEHSILSARRKNRDAASTLGRRNSEEEVKQFWKQKKKGYERRSRRDHAPCRRGSSELLEEDFEVYVDKKLRMLQQFYVNYERRKNDIAGETEESVKEEGIRGSSGAPLGVIAESEGAELNGDDQEPPSETSDVEVTATLVRPEDASPKETSGESSEENKGEATIEEVVPDLRDEKGVEEKMGKNAKTGEWFTGKLHARPPDFTNRDTLIETEKVCSGRGRVEDSDRGRPPEAPSLGRTVTVVQLPCDLESSLWSERCDREKRKMKMRAEWFPGKVDPVDISVGQAQFEWDPYGFKYDGWDPGDGIMHKNASKDAMECPGSKTHIHHQAFINFQQITDFVDNYEGVSTSSRVLKNPIIRSVQFNTEERWVKIANEIEIKKLLLSAGEILNWNQGSGAMLLEFVMGGTTKKINIEEAFEDLLQADRGVDKEARKSNIDLEIGKTDLAQSPKALMEICVEHLIGGSEFSRMQLLEALLKSWDPGESEYSSCIIETSCFKLWDPGGGRLLTVGFWYLHLEDKVNV